MNQTLSIIKREHGNLRAVLYSLQALADDLANKGAQADFKAFHAILTYVDTFIHQFHHPKEDLHLFPVLKRRYPEAESLLADLEDDHERGTALLNELRRALSIYEFRGDRALPEFCKAVDAYITFERDHARKEELELFPLAEAHLKEEDWEKIYNAFADNNDPVFGDKPRKEFETLHTTIVNLIPSPYGVGPAWGSDAGNRKAQ
ncbi:MAG: hemerythrin domain-containing protein [Gammaproteobacteria bacterium]